MSNQERKIALVVDNCPAHKDISGLKAVNLVFLSPPPRTRLKVHYCKQIVAKKLSAIDQDADFNVSILNAIRMLKSAWAAVTAVTINICYRHAGFQEGESVTSADPEKDADDDIPLAQLVRIIGSHVSIDEYLDIDRELPATEEVTDKTSTTSSKPD